MSEQKEKIKVIIAGRSIPLRVPAEEVQQIQHIVAEINRKVLEFQNTYQSKDIRECLSMVLLTYAVDLNKLKSGHMSDVDLFSPELTRIDQLLDQYMQTS